MNDELVPVIEPDSVGTLRDTGRGGGFGGMEVLQCYNPRKTERFCMIGVLQRCYTGATGCYESRLVRVVLPASLQHCPDKDGLARHFELLKKAA